MADVALRDPHRPVSSRPDQGLLPTLAPKAEAWRCAVPCRLALAGEGGSLGRTPAHGVCVSVGTSVLVLGPKCALRWGILPHLPSPYPATEPQLSHGRTHRGGPVATPPGSSGTPLACSRGSSREWLLRGLLSVLRDMQGLASV